MTSIQISSHVMGAESTRSSVPPAFVPPVAPGCEGTEDRRPEGEEEPVARPPQVSLRRAPEDVAELARGRERRERRDRSREVRGRRPQRAEEREDEIEDVRRRQRAPRRRPVAERDPEQR